MRLLFRFLFSALGLLVASVLVPGIGVSVNGNQNWIDFGGPFRIQPAEVVEMALAHAISNRTEAAYRRGDLLAKRRQLMEAWARYVTGGAVVSVVREA